MPVGVNVLCQTKLSLVLVGLPVLMAAVGHEWGTATMVSGLPEGAGIAAKHPGDQGIEQDPAVVFADGFETTAAGLLPSGYRKEDGKRWDNSWGARLVTEKPESVHSGRGASEHGPERTLHGMPLPWE